MAGRLGFFEYVSDNGSIYTIQMDESNAVAVGNTFASDGGTKLPRDQTIPRYLTLEAPNPTAGLAPLRRQIVVCNATTAAWTAPPATYLLAVVGAAPTAFTVTGAVGERRTDLQIF